MKVGIIGAYKYEIDIKDFGKCMPENTTEIICGRPGRLRYWAELYTLLEGVIFSPISDNYKMYGRKARMQRNIEIIKKSDIVIFSIQEIER